MPFLIASFSREAPIDVSRVSISFGEQSQRSVTVSEQSERSNGSLAHLTYEIHASNAAHCRNIREENLWAMKIRQRIAYETGQAT